ncbi:MAG: branched-chain-amino-acid transaminase [Verrucomicrobiales bacterium]|jgi:branched-chain amino acid aminotransferase|nr:branched-chain-amino-acid transaminase [Verrucomicrobiales bacterium]
MKIYIDGEFHDKENAKISVFDHGLLYGDGVFEGIRAYNGRVFRLREHITRLFDSAKALMLNMPLTVAEMEDVVLETCRRNELCDGYIRLVVTRGAGDLGLNPIKCPRATVFCIATGIAIYPEEVYEKGLKLITAATQRVPQNALSSAVKSLNYLNQILVRLEGNLAGADELVVLNHEGYVAECSADNIFVLLGGKIVTPPVSAGALGGITRQTVMELAPQAGITISEANLTRYDLWTADEIFLTGTAAEVVPVRELDGRVIGSGQPGPWTRKFIAAYRALTRGTGAEIFGNSNLKTHISKP